MAKRPYGMSPQVLSSVVRILTNKRIYRPPDPLERVLAFAADLLDQPHCQIIQPGPRHWRIFSDLCTKNQCSWRSCSRRLVRRTGHRRSGCEWITLDRDFRRFVTVCAGVHLSGGSRFQFCRFCPDNGHPGKWHKILIKVDRLKAARSGYLAR